jgi:hypothetical protein
MPLRASVSIDRTQFFEIQRIRANLRSSAFEDDAVDSPKASMRGDLDLPGVRSQAQTHHRSIEP